MSEDIFGSKANIRF